MKKSLLLTAVFALGLQSTAFADDLASCTYNAGDGHGRKLVVLSKNLDSVLKGVLDVNPEAEGKCVEGGEDDTSLTCNLNSEEVLVEVIYLRKKGVASEKLDIKKDQIMKVQMKSAELVMRDGKYESIDVRVSENAQPYLIIRPVVAKKGQKNLEFNLTGSYGASRNAICEVQASPM